MQVWAPAKINLILRVLGKRADGFHELESIFQMLTLADRLTLDSADELTFTCSDPALENEENLVVRAARMLQPYCPIQRGARIHLEKRIPTQAGLGGGSSDGAAALLALNELWEIRRPLDELAPLAAALGSDVPFFLYTPCAIVRGRGEDVTPLPHNTPCHVVLAKPSAGLSTAMMYAELRARPYIPPPAPRFLPETQSMARALAKGDAAAVAGALANDLEGPALVQLPELYHIRERMLQLGALGVLLCGSGSAVFGICPDAATAEHAALDLTNDCPWTTSAAFCPIRGTCP
ncbi:MAG: 4-(cytidine 5'-diphospho)-2-C-methyl-D-erythritol kinase [Armatimonadota bacterium]